MNKEQYLLVCLMEEAAEVQQACAKSIRFTAESQSWEFDGTNWESICSEMNDLNTVFHELIKIKGLDEPSGRPLFEQREKKLKKMEKYMQESIDLGILDK